MEERFADGVRRRPRGTSSAARRTCRSRRRCTTTTPTSPAGRSRARCATSTPTSRPRDTARRLRALLRSRDHDVFCLNDHDSSGRGPARAAADAARVPRSATSRCPAASRSSAGQAGFRAPDRRRRPFTHLGISSTPDSSRPRERPISTGTSPVERTSYESRSAHHRRPAGRVVVLLALILGLSEVLAAAGAASAETPTATATQVTWAASGQQAVQRPAVAAAARPARVSCTYGNQDCPRLPPVLGAGPARRSRRPHLRGRRGGLPHRLDGQLLPVEHIGGRGHLGVDRPRRRPRHQIHPPGRRRRRCQGRPARHAVHADRADGEHRRRPAS